MVFLQPILLLGGLGIGLPILIHLLNKYKIPEMHWAAMQLLKHAVVSRSRKIKLEDILLLFLRCLAILLIALALARPVLPVNLPGVNSTGGNAQGTVIALDGSYSMSCHAGVSGRFERALKQVRDVLHNVAAGTRLTVLEMGQRPRLIYKSSHCNPNEVLELLNKIEVLPEGLSLEPSLESVLQSLKDMEVSARECYFISDSQRLSWSDLSPDAKARIKDIGLLSSVYYLNCGDDAKENLAVTRLRPVSGHLIKGGMVRFAADIWNPGAQNQNNVKVQLVLEDTVVDEKTIETGARQTVPVFLFARLKTAGPVRVTAKIAQDSVMLDNARHAVIQVRNAIRILCVDSNAGAEQSLESQYLAAAFTPNKAKSAVGGMLEVERASRLKFTGLRLFDYQIIVLANVPELPQASVDALHDFVEWGGGLIVFAGDQLNPKLVNLSFNHAGDPLLPCELGEAVGDAEKQDLALPMEWTGDDFSLTQNLKAMPKEMIAETLFYRHFNLKLRPNALEILRFQSENGKGGTLLCQKAIGRGKVLFFNCTADDQWTNFPRTMLFPILLHQAVSELTQQDSDRASTVGEPLSAALPPEIVSDQVTLTDPKGVTTTLKVPPSEGRRMFSYPRAEWPGFYLVQAEKKGVAKAPPAAAPVLDSSPALKLAVNIDTHESDIACLQNESLAAAFAGLPVQVVDGTNRITQTIQQSRTGLELWRPILVCAFFVFLLEFLLAHRFSKRKAMQIQQPAEGGDFFSNLRKLLPRGKSMATAMPPPAPPFQGGDFAPPPLEKGGPGGVAGEERRPT
jgi:hypothetical protein